VKRKPDIVVMESKSSAVAIIIAILVLVAAVSWVAIMVHLSDMSHDVEVECQTLGYDGGQYSFPQGKVCVCETWRTLEDVRAGEAVKCPLDDEG
jgi:hypothetical protein